MIKPILKSMNYTIKELKTSKNTHKSLMGKTVRVFSPEQAGWTMPEEEGKGERWTITEAEAGQFPFEDVWAKCGNAATCLVVEIGEAPDHPGIYVKGIMKRRKITQNKFSRDTGIPPSLLSLILTGNGGITPSIAIAFSEYFGISAHNLMERQIDYQLWRERRNPKRNRKPKKEINKAPKARVLPSSLSTTAIETPPSREPIETAKDTSTERDAAEQLDFVFSENHEQG